MEPPASNIKAWLRMEGWVKRSISIGLGLAFFAAVACTVSAETVAECQNNYPLQARRGGRNGTEDPPRQLLHERQPVARTRQRRHRGHRSLLRKRDRIVEGIFRWPT